MSTGEFLEAVFLGVGLAMDALAVSAALGAAGRRNFTWRKIALTALFFGGFQYFMPLAGWLAGALVGSVVRQWGKIVASGLLFVLGGKMIVERDSEEVKAFTLGQLTILAFATSIDALLVGVGYACLGRSSVWWDVLIIGIVTALISAAGCVAGRLSGKLLGKHCAVAGGAVLILIGVKILCFG